MSKKEFEEFQITGFIKGLEEDTDGNYALVSASNDDLKLYQIRIHDEYCYELSHIMVKATSDKVQDLIDYCKLMNINKFHVNI